MTSTWTRLALVAGIVAAPATVHGQKAHELGIQATATATDPWMLVAGPRAGAWLASRVRLVGFAGLGVSDDDLAWRVEGVAHFHLNPQSQGVGVYGGAGLALAGVGNSDEYLVALVGLESSAARGEGWFMEAGVGGGVRIAAGYRWRLGG